MYVSLSSGSRRPLRILKGIILGDLGFANKLWDVAEKRDSSS
jgi:hypothetical protein